MHKLQPAVSYSKDGQLARSMANTPGLIRQGVTVFDKEFTFPLQPLYLENVYAYPDLMRRIGDHGLRAAAACRADVIVGAESAGIPLATQMAVAARMPLAYVRKPGYLGHVDHEPRTRGASVEGKRVLIVDDAVWRGHSLRGFLANLESEGAHLAGVFVMVDMRALWPEPWLPSATPPWPDFSYFACCSYHELLEHAHRLGILGSRVYRLVRCCLDEQWGRADARWQELIAAGSSEGRSRRVAPEPALSANSSVVGGLK